MTLEKNLLSNMLFSIAIQWIEKNFYLLNEFLIGKSMKRLNFLIRVMFF